MIYGRNSTGKRIAGGFTLLMWIYGIGLIGYKVVEYWINHG